MGTCLAFRRRDHDRHMNGILHPESAAETRIVHVPGFGDIEVPSHVVRIDSNQPSCARQIPKALLCRNRHNGDGGSPVPQEARSVAVSAAAGRAAQSRVWPAAEKRSLQELSAAACGIECCRFRLTVTNRFFSSTH